ncbi:hypothetical protein Bbelb_050850 [Branchiostoma belcheri]|nr:hypothetical protein Bbelb_050850 [Branchiostoma belcheri]
MFTYFWPYEQGTQDADDDTVFVNPHSATAMGKVLRHVGKIASIGCYNENSPSTRQRLIVALDGLPLGAANIIQTLIEMGYSGKEAEKAAKARRMKVTYKNITRHFGGEMFAEPVLAEAHNTDVREYKDDTRKIVKDEERLMTVTIAKADRAAKLGMALLIRNLMDATREGDGERVARCLKMTLLFFRAYGHTNCSGQYTAAKSRHYGYTATQEGGTQVALKEVLQTIEDTNVDFDFSGPAFCNINYDSDQLLIVENKLDQLSTDQESLKLIMASIYQYVTYATFNIRPTDSLPISTVQKTFPHIGWDTIRSHLKQTLKVRRQGMRRRQRRASAEQSNAAAAATQPQPPVMVMMGGVELGTGVVVERGQTSVTMTVVTLTEAGKGHPAFADKEKSSSCNEQLKRELDKMTAEHVIGPVTVPTSWVSSLVTVMKPRSHYPAPVIEDIVPELKKAKVFSVLDAKSGYWQIALDKESSMLTTFNTPNGRYKWKRLPLTFLSPIAIVNGDFETAGEAMVMSIVHLGPTPSCLHPAIVSALCGENLPDMSGFQPVDQEAAAFVAKLASATEASLKDLLESDEGLNITTMAGWQKPAGSTIFADVLILRLQDLVISRKDNTSRHKEQYEAAKTAILQSDPSVKNKSAYIEDVRLDCPASLKVGDIVIIDPGRKQHDANKPRVVVVMEVQRSNINAKFITGGFGKTWDVSGYDTAICDLCQLSEMVFDPKNGTTEVRTFTVEGRKHPLEDNRRTRNRVASAPTTNTPDQHHHPYHGRILTTTPSPIPRPYPDYDTITHTTAVS